MQVQVGTPILQRNNDVARDVSRLLCENKLVMVNMMSSPGAGKTTLLEKTLDHLNEKLSIGVIEGDLATTQDADRIAARNVPVVQINTGGGCHLDAAMIREALGCFDLDRLDLLIVENVGNLVCPAEFNLGEDIRVTLLSVAEGNDKIVKYPAIFRACDALVLNKTDLLPFTDFCMERFYRDVRHLNDRLTVMETSARTGEGLEEWCRWLESKSKSKG